MLNKKSFNNVLVIIAGFIFLIGVLQIAFFLPAPIEAMKNAASQGVPSEQIVKYFWQQVMPQVLTYIMVTLGFAFTILGVRSLGLKVDELIAAKGNSQGEALSRVNSEEVEIDDFLEEFEIVSDHNNNN